MSSYLDTVKRSVSKYVTGASVPQTDPLDSRQVKNNAGGFVYQITDSDYIRRIIVMGTTKPTYYATSQKLSDDAIEFLKKLITDGKGMMILDILKDVHETGSAPKMGMTLAVLGVLTRCDDDKVRKASLDYTIYGLRTLSQVYTWLDFHKASGVGKGFGRGPKAVLTARFYNNKAVDINENGENKSKYWDMVKKDPRKYFKGVTATKFAYDVTKYGSRSGFSISDLFSLIHPKPEKIKRPKVKKSLKDGKPVYTEVDGTRGNVNGYKEWPMAMKVVLKYIKKGYVEARKLALGDIPKDKNGDFAKEDYLKKNSEIDTETCKVLTYLWACDYAKRDNAKTELVCQLIKDNKLPREVMNTKLLNKYSIWMALLFKDPSADELVINMPITALIRNIGVMSSKGMFDKSIGDASRKATTLKVINAVCSHLTNQAILVGGRIHPANVVVALMTYQHGRASRGKTTWAVCPEIVTALNKAVELSYHTIKPTGEDELHYIDISGSMSCGSTAIEGLNAAQVVSLQALAFVKASIRENAGRQIIGLFDTSDTLVYDSSPDASALKTNKTNKVDMANIAKDYGFNYHRADYSSYSRYTQNNVTPENNIFDPMSVTFQEMSRIIMKYSMGSTDCSIPILRAISLAKKGISKPKNIYVYTDNETYHGFIHPVKAMEYYRTLVPGAKLIVVAATPTQFSIADPKDPGMLDIAGFDVGAATVIWNFAKKK